MKRSLPVWLFSMFILLTPDYLRSQDTITVQTFTFDSITTRRGVWQFPEGEQFRKILMYYTLKCDPQTQHDQYWCGEWDYLTYNNIHQHTGEYDSTLYHQPSFTLISGVEKDSLLLREEPAYNYFARIHKQVHYPDTLNISTVSIGKGTLELPFFAGSESKAQFLWKAEELLAAGLTVGEISGLKLDIVEPGDNPIHLGIKMKNVELDSLNTGTLIRDMQAVYFNQPDLSETDTISLNFFESFEWDGESDIIVEFSTEYKQAALETKLNAHETEFPSTILYTSENQAINLDGESDFLMAPPSTYFNSDFTIETWIYKRSNNRWSRVFDFGTGPGQDNVIMTFTNNTSGRLSVHVNYDGLNRSFKSPEEIPLKEWVHVSITLTMHIGWIYINGELAGYGQLQQPKDTVRTKNYFGKSNWPNDAYADGMIDEFRIFNYAKTEEQIKEDFNRSLKASEINDSLMLYYKFDEMNKHHIQDHSMHELHAEAYGFPSLKKIRADRKYLDPMVSNLRPNIIFERIESSTVDVDEEMVYDSVAASPVQIVIFQDGDDPTIPVDTISKYLGGYHYILNEEGNIVDSIHFDSDEIMYRDMIPYYGEPFEIIDKIEIGRFITPYGIGLDLGPQGFTWVYDVTDYASLLQGEVDMSAGNQQELIDLKFTMIKGTPPREVLKIDKVWGDRRSYTYKNLDDDVDLSEVSVPLLQEAETFKLKTRITGHGHHSNTGDYPHCCEWKDNTHYLLVNGNQVADWHIFQYNECAENAVFPQGGTWPGAREGWCPGDVVKLNEFEITDYIQGDEVSLDYEITPVPPDNQGMGNGNYHIAMHLMQYSSPNFENDVELYDVIVPNEWEYYSRKNPACSDPKVIIRNNGTSTLNSLNIRYGVVGGEQQNYLWEGELKSMEFEKITLPVPGAYFWFGDSTNRFKVTVLQPNGMKDEYAANDTYTTSFIMPDMYDQKIALWLKTNKQAYRYSLIVKDVLGEILLSRTGLANDSLYVDTLDIEDGCYTIRLLDEENMGLSYWAYPAQGSGYFRICDMEGNILKSFEPEFGRSINYSFLQGDISFVQDPGLDQLVNVYPNPAGDYLYINLKGIHGQVQVNLFDMLGRPLLNEQCGINGNELRLKTASLKSGMYLLFIRTEQLRLKRKIIVRN